MPSPFGAIVTVENYSLTPSNTELRSQVDPTETLPEVTFNVFEKEDIPGDFAREKVTISHAGEIIGWCDLITDYFGKRMHFDFITLDSADRYDTRNMDEVPKREDRPKGLGLASYLVAIETAHNRGLPFESQDGDLSVGSNHVWEILANKAVATVVEQSRRYNRGDIEKVIAKYRAEIPRPA